MGKQEEIMRKKERKEKEGHRKKIMIMRLILINTDRNSNEGEIIRLSEET